MSNMTFNWKMKQNHRMTVTMFSPDSFKMNHKPQKTVTTTQAQQPPKIIITQEPNLQPQKQPINEMQDCWEFHTENPRRVTKTGVQPPPLEKMTSAPGNLQQFITQASMGKQSIKQFHVNPSPNGQFSNRNRRRTRTSSNVMPPSLQTQASAPSMTALVSPINRNKQRKTKATRPNLQNTKKLASTSDLKSKLINSSYKPPPLITRNSEGNLPGIRRLNDSRTLPSLNALVSGSPADSPNSSPNSSCNESDQEMRDVEKQTSKMSIQNLLVPGFQ